MKWAGSFEKALAERTSGGVDTRDYAVERFCPMKLGKRVLPEELDLLGQIEGKDPGLPERMGLTQEQMAFRFRKIRDLLVQELGCSEQAASICVAQAARGKDLQHAGRPQIPSPKRVRGALNWLLQTTHAKKEDGTLRACIEKYPFMLSKPVDAFHENRDLCPEGIDYAFAVLFRPRNVDKTFQCGGVCKSRCGSCWYS